MKKLFIVLVFLSVILCLNSCDTDPYIGKRPTDYPDSTWVCEEYKVSFSVNTEGYLENNIITINGEDIEFGFAWGMYNSYVSIFKIKDESTEELFNGYCDFADDKFSVRIDNTNNYFDKDSVILNFTRK